MSIFSDLKPFAKNNRNVFDLSHTDTFSTKVGMMTPVFVQHTVPDSKYKIDMGAICRTVPMQKANFTSIKTDVDFFFVPYRQLWSSFPAFYYGRYDKQSNIDNNIDNVYPTIPTYVGSHFDYNSVCKYLIQAAVAQYVYQRLKDMHKQFILLDNANQLSFKITESAYTQTHTFTGVAYQMQFDMVMDYILDKYFGKSFPESVFTDEGVHYRDIHGRICVYDMIRTFDMLGYGNLLPIVKAFTSSLEYLFTKYTNYILSGSYEVSYGDIVSLPHLIGLTVFHSSIITEATMEAAFQYFSNFIGNLIVEGSNSEQVYDFRLPTVNPLDYIPTRHPNAFAIMANFKIWSDFYRNSQYDDRDYSYLYNIDYSIRTGAGISDQKIIAMLCPLYHLYQRDMFTGGYPSAQFGEVAVAGLTPEWSEIKVKDLGNPNSEISSVFSQNIGDRAGVLHIEDIGNSSGYLAQLNSSAVSALAVRQAMAIQRWKETILRAGNRERDLLEAMFGVHSKYINDKYVDYVASFNGQINVNPVASTTENENASVGELGAYAVGQITGKEFDFATNEFGVLIGVMYIRPEVKYDAYGLDPMNTKLEQNDYYNPKFQNLGLAPVFSYYYNNFTAPPVVDSISRDKVLNYLSRYWEYKTKVSRVHGEFYNSTPLLLSSFDTTNASHSVQIGYVASSRGSKASMVSVRDVHALETAVLSSLYIAPNALDTLFYADEDGFLSSDQFDVEMSFQVKAILPMSVEGLPNS